MRCNLKGTNIDLTDEIRSYIERKMGALDDLLSDVDAARVDAELEYLESEEKTYRAELMLHDGSLLRADARGISLHEAIDRAAQELYLELARAKKKRRGLWRRGAMRMKEYVRGWRSTV